MTHPEIVFREATADDDELLHHMLFEVWLWDPERSRAAFPEWVKEHDEAGRPFSRGFGTLPGDAGFIAEAGEPVGAAWYRLFDADNAQRGFIADDIPDIAIAVLEDFRGRGLGRRLMERLIDRARRDGLPGLSLHVNARNSRARRLYESVGFVEHHRDDVDPVMLLSFSHQ